MQHNLFLCLSDTVMYIMISEGCSDAVYAMCEANGLLNLQH